MGRFTPLDGWDQVHTPNFDIFKSFAINFIRGLPGYPGRFVSFHSAARGFEPKHADKLLSIEHVKPLGLDLDKSPKQA